MTRERNLDKLVQHWLERAEESLASARSELEAGRLSFVVNRLYYAVFYIVTAALAAKGTQHVKHSVVRASFHREFVRAGYVEKPYGRLYDELFHARHQGDYVPMVLFEDAVVRQQLQDVEKFISEIAPKVWQMHDMN